MRKGVRVSVIAGVCALFLLLPVILFGRVMTPANLLQQTNPAVVAFSIALYELFGLAFAIFVYGFARIGARRGNGIVVWGAYLLSLSYVLSILIGILAVLNLAHLFAAVADLPMIVARGAFACQLGVGMCFSRDDGNSLALWVGVAALATGLGTISQLFHAGWDDLADIPFLVTGTLYLFLNE